MRAALAALLLAASAALPAAAQEQVRMMRLSADRAGAASIVRVERGGPAAVSVVVVEAGRARLFLRRAAQDGGATAYEAWLDARPGITVTRAGPGPLVLEAGGMTLRIHEADLGLRTVRCWIGALTARMEPRLLTAASDVRVLKEWLGRDRLADEFLPMRILWSAGEEPNLAPRGDLKAEEGAFTGAPWDDLLRLAKDELGP
jgi:hypothetical protein